MKASANLAKRPTRNERLPLLLVVVGGLAVLAVTAVHGFEVRRLLGRKTTDLERETRQLEGTIQADRAALSSVRVPRPPKETLDRWRLCREMVDRRAFAWTELFQALERALPPDVRLESISPRPKAGEVTVELTAVARNHRASQEFFEALRRSPDFRDALPSSIDEKDGQVVVNLATVWKSPSLSGTAQ